MLEQAPAAAGTTQPGSIHLQLPRIHHGKPSAEKGVTNSNCKCHLLCDADVNCDRRNSNLNFF